MKLKIMIAIMIGYVFVNFIFYILSRFLFSIKSFRLPVIENHLLIWNKIAHDVQKCFIKQQHSVVNTSLNKLFVPIKILNGFCY